MSKYLPEHVIPNTEPTYDERPWGTWELLTMGPTYKVKRLCILPNQRLSLQYHEGRSEHWVLVQGKAQVQCNDDITVLEPDGHFYVPRKGIHRITNIGDTPLVIIEVQVGTCDENDITRIEDDYGRA